MFTGWIWSCTAQTWREDMIIIYKQPVQPAIITLGTEKMFAVTAGWEKETLSCAEEVRDVSSSSSSSSVLLSPCMHRACLSMQSSTDGRVGGWVLSAHRSSRGSVVPLLFCTQARRTCRTRSMETYQGRRVCFGYAALTYT